MRLRRDRLHDERNNSISFKDLKYIFLSGIDKILENFNSDLRVLPIINYSAIKFFSKYLNKEMSLLEYGSGKSTKWYAEKVKTIVSVEDNKEWYLKVKNYLTKFKINNVKQVFAKNPEEYLKCYEKYNLKISDFNVIIIDGSYRNKCAEMIIEEENLKNTVIYLDDSDKCWSIDPNHVDKDPDSNALSAYASLLYHLHKRNFICSSLRNFAPTYFTIKEGTFFIHKDNKIALEIYKDIYF